MSDNTQVVKSGSRLSAVSREVLTGYLFISPWLIGLLLLTGGPILFSFFLSFTEWNGIGGLGAIKWRGLENFRQMLVDERFPKYIYNTLVFTLGSVPLTMAGGILVALLMNQKLKYIAVFRTIFYLPSVTTGVAATLLWFYIFQPQYGRLNYSIRQLGELLDALAAPLRWFLPIGEIHLEGPEWLVSPRWVKTAYIIMSLLGIGAGIYSAGLQGIPEQLYVYEAAEIDGANMLQQFRHVTLPMLSTVIFFSLIISIIGSFQVFKQAYILSGGTASPADAARFFMAAATVALMPILILFFIGQKYFIQGIATTGLKG